MPVVEEIGLKFIEMLCYNSLGAFSDLKNEVQDRCEIAADNKDELLSCQDKSSYVHARLNDKKAKISTKTLLRKAKKMFQINFSQPFCYRVPLN